jgi:hypothetical protein
VEAVESHRKLTPEEIEECERAAESKRNSVFVLGD